MTHNDLTTEDSLCWINTASSGPLTSCPGRKVHCCQCERKVSPDRASTTDGGSAGEMTTRLAPRVCFQVPARDVGVVLLLPTHMDSSGLLSHSH